MGRRNSQDALMRALIGQMARRVIPDDENLVDALKALAKHMRAVENAWLQCHTKHVELTGAVEPEPGVYAIVAGLCGVGFTFSQVEDYEMAIELALRAFYEGAAVRAAQCADGCQDPRASLLRTLEDALNVKEVIAETEAAHAATTVAAGGTTQPDT